MERAIHELDLVALGRDLRTGVLTSRQIAEHFLDRIARLDSRLNSFILVTRERALVQADAADALFRSGAVLGPLQGIPYGLKDIFEVETVPMTCNSYLMEHFKSRHTAQMVSALEAQGAVLLGKLATHEFALGGPSFELPYPPARNPWNCDYFTGASSSGSGAAVAAGLAPLAFGSDTSGSIRGPASYCGVVGFKPTYGLVSRHGVFPLSYSLDHCGPLARTARDCAIATQAVAGFDPKDISSIDAALDFSASLGISLHGVKVGVLRSHFREGIGLAPVVASAIENALDLMRQAGATVENAEVPDFARFNACGRTIMMSEAYAVHLKNMQSSPERFGRYTYQRLAQGAFFSAADYINAQRQRLSLTQEFNRVAERYDILVAAGHLQPPPRITDFSVDWPPPPELTATQTIVANVTGCPAASVPIGFTPDGLPLGMQIMGPPLGDAKVLGVCQKVQDLIDLRGARPSVY